MENQQEPVLVATPAQRTPGPATPGMDRQQAFATDGTWSGFVRTEAGMISGWHHHGDYETVIYVLRGGLKMEFGPNGSSTVEAILGTLSMCRRAPYTGKATPLPSLLTSSWCGQVSVTRHSTSTVQRRPDPTRPQQPSRVKSAEVRRDLFREQPQLLVDSGYSFDRLTGEGLHQRGVCDRGDVVVDAGTLDLGLDLARDFLGRAGDRQLLRQLWTVSSMLLASSPSFMASTMGVSSAWSTPFRASCSCDIDEA